MKASEFRIRDPYVLLDGGKYYLYGTTRLAADSISGTGKMGFDVYVSDDLVEWDGPHAVFDPPADFWGIRDFWAPEVHYYKGAYYIFATFKDSGMLHGIGILKSDSPMGPFHVHSEVPITSREWSSLDGTLYVDKQGVPYMVFCHEWSQIIDGTMCYAQLSDDLTHFVTEPVTMFAASEIPFVRSAIMRLSGKEGYITDGPCMYRTKTGELLMLWSSKGEQGYMECIMRSDNGEIDGKFIPVEVLFPKDGGHGMLFNNKDGELFFSLHTPNSPTKERAHFFAVEDCGDTIKRK